MTLQIGRLQREEIIGHTAEEVGFVLAPDVQAEFNHQLIETGRVKNLEASWTRHDTQTIVKVAAEIIEIGGVPHLLVMFDDITALKQAEQARVDKERELSDLKTRMMHRISHEFRTPLAIIQTSTGQVLNYHDRLIPEQQQALTRCIEGQISSLTDMLSSISRIVRDEFQGQVFSPKRLDLVTLVQAVIQELQLADDQRHPIQLETQMPVIEILGDYQQLHSLITHVLANALMYSPPDKPINLTLSIEAPFVGVRIQDEGIGILPEELDRVTEPFFRGSNFDERPGLGLGLTLARNIIDLHHGMLSIESVPEQGTTVEVRLPI